MYQSPIATHGFNHQSLYGQPVANLRQIHEVVWNPNNVTQSTNGVTPYTYSLNTNQQFAPEYGNLGKQIYPPSMNTNHIKTHSNKTLVNNHRENTLNNPTGTTNNANPSMRQSRNTSLVPNANPDRFLPRQSSLGAMSEIRTAPLKETAKLFTSRSAGTVNDYIQRERKSHTMAPLTRITGPSSNITTSLFASTIAPGDAQVVKASHVSQTASNIPFSSYPQSNDEMTDSSHRDDIDEDNGEDDDDDDAPIIVKVQYDPDAGGPPSEDVIRKAVDNQLKGKSRSSAAAEPIVLNFLNPPAPPRIPSVPIRPQQPIFNRPIPPLPQFINRPQHQVPISPQQENLASIQQRQFDKQLFLQQQQQLQQQHLQFQANQRQQQQKQQRLQFQANQQPQQEQRRQQLQGQQFQLQANQQQQQEQRQQLQLQGQQFQLQANQQPLEQQRQQLHLQGQQFQLQANQQPLEQQRQQLHLQGQQFQLQGNQKAQQQQRQQQQQGKQFQLQANQQPQQQQQHRQQQEYLLQPQNSRHDLQKFLLQQSQLEQQQKEEKLQQIQKQLKADQHEIQQLIQQQLLLERQQQQQQRYRQLFQQQQRQRQQELQENQQIHSSQQYASLPPMGPRPPRTTSSIPTSPPYQPPITTVPNNESRPPQPCPPAPVPLRNPQEYPTITIQKLPNRNVNSVIPSTSASSGLNAYSKHSYQYIPNTFIPIHAEGPFGQAFSPMNNNSTRNFPPKLSQRPHTAPSSTEMFRPSSVSDVPELSKENLSSMLDRIPDLHGRRFSIEYTEPADLTGYPIPSQSNGTNARYPDGVIVDQLPNNIIQHVKRSNNTQLQAALNLSDQSKKIVPFNGNLSELENSSLKVFHHVARPRDRVKQSRPVFSMISSDTDSNDEANTSDEEREIEETKIEFILRSK